MIYAVKTERFGTVLVERDNIDEARAWAKSAHGVGPRAVSRHYDLGERCERCDSRPCCCAPRGTAIAPVRCERCEPGEPCRECRAASDELALLRGPGQPAT